MSAFEKGFTDVVGMEGRYSNNPNDSGGETMFGITVKTARAVGYAGPIKDMPLEVAKRIYKIQYWDLLKLDQVAEMSATVACEMFEASVNCGPAVAGGFLQTALNVFNRQQKNYPDVEVDGLIGPSSLYALKQYFATHGKRAEAVMLKALNCQQGSFYLTLSLKRPKDEEFAYGWLANRVFGEIK